MPDLLSPEAVQSIFRDLGSILAKISNNELRIKSIQETIEKHVFDIAERCAIHIQNTNLSNRSLDITTNRVESNCKTLTDLGASVNKLKDQVAQIIQEEKAENKKADRLNKLLIAAVGLLSSIGGGLIVALL